MAKITIIDDDVETARDIAQMLESNGHVVKASNTTRDLVPQMVTDPPDLLILDVMFPDNPVAGFDAARKVRRHQKLRSVPIILLTAVNQKFPTNFSATDIDGTWMPVQDLVEKSVSMPVLLDKVNQLLKKRRQEPC